MISKTFLHQQPFFDICGVTSGCVKFFLDGSLEVSAALACHLFFIFLLLPFTHFVSEFTSNLRWNRTHERKT